MKTIETWDDLKYWSTGEWDVAQERLDKCGAYNPSMDNMFKSLLECPYPDVRVIIVGQDPYPNHLDATGLAFSVPANRRIPPTLANILNEYVCDLHLPHPATGDLTPWCAEGVLLWNAIPSCETNKSMSHDWEEWKFLTKEIIEKASAKGCVCVFLGAVARRFSVDVNPISICLEYSHPSPRGAQKGIHPFVGSRIFTTINSHLNRMGLGYVDWNLGGSRGSQGKAKAVQRPHH